MITATSISVRSMHRWFVHSLITRHLCSKAEMASVIIMGPYTCRRGIDGAVNREHLIPSVFPPLSISRRMAGHSHWQNIKSTKTARDAARSMINDKCLRLIRAAMRESGTSDPKGSDKLARAIRHARNNEVPVAKIESALKGPQIKDVMEPYYVDIKGPGNCFIIVETLTDHKKRTLHTLKFTVKKIPLTTVLDGGAGTHIFDHKGVILVEMAENVTLERAMDDAIEVGAEDVKLATDGNGKEVIQFLSDPKEFYAVCKRLEELKYNIVSSELLFLANVKQKLNQEALDLVQMLYEQIEKLPEVVKIHDNIE